MIKQEAILLTKDNALVIAKTLADHTAQELLGEADHLFILNPEMNHVVLCTDLFEDGMRLTSYIVHESLYKANNSNFAYLNDKTYVPVKTI